MCRLRRAHDGSRYRAKLRRLRSVSARSDKDELTRSSSTSVAAGHNQVGRLRIPARWDRYRYTVRDCVCPVDLVLSGGRSEMRTNTGSLAALLEPSLLLATGCVHRSGRRGRLDFGFACFHSGSWRSFRSDNSSGDFRSTNLYGWSSTTFGYQPVTLG